MAFIGPNDFLVLEKNTGAVKRVTNSVLQGGLLEGRFGSERGLLGIALHPGFPMNLSVYLYWTCRSTVDLDTDPFRPEEPTQLNHPGGDVRPAGYGQLAPRPVAREPGSTASGGPTTASPGVEREEAARVPERWRAGSSWTGRLRPASAWKPRRRPDCVQARRPASSPPVTWVAAGRCRTWPVGRPADTGRSVRRPGTDAAHLSGVILRLNDNGTTPADNPFLTSGSAVGDVFAYGSEHVRDRFRPGVRSAVGPAERRCVRRMNRVEREMNGGWVQIMGPVGGSSGSSRSKTRSLRRVAWPVQRSSRSAGRRPTSPVARRRRSRACTSCRDRTTTRSGVQLEVCDTAGEDRPSRAARSARSTRTTCSRERRRR